MAGLNKQIKAVAPYIHPEFLNFKMAAYNAWNACGGQTAPEHYPWRAFHGLVFRHELPSFFHSKEEARLRFVEPVSLSFDTFPDYARYEIIPMIWDCWPRYYDKVEKWMKKHKVRTAIFTSKQEMDEMKRRLPNLNAMHCPEAVDTTLYDGGKDLKDRKIDLLEFGRGTKNIFDSSFQKLNSRTMGINYVRTKVNGKFVYTNEELYTVMGDAKMVIALPRSITNPEDAESVETLTQRYWENMLSRNVMIGHAPQELIDLIGYNPVIEIKEQEETIIGLITHILAHINDYQKLVDKNRKVALEFGNWKVRMNHVQNFLVKQGYSI